MNRKLLIVLLGLFLMASAAIGQGRKYYHIQFVDEWNEAVTTMTSITVSTSAGGTATLYTTQTGSTEYGSSGVITTGIDDGAIEFWYEDTTIDITATDGSYTRSVNDMGVTTTRIQWPSYLVSTSSTSYADSSTITMGDGSDWVIQGGSTADLLRFTPANNGAVFRVGTSDGANCADLQWYTASGVGLLIDEGANTLGITGLTTSINASSNYDTNINTGTSTGAVNIGSSTAGAISIDSTSTVSINSDSTLALSTTDASADITITSAAGSVTITGTEAAADAVVISAATALGGIDITSNADIDITTTGAATEDISIINTGGSVWIEATEAAADAVTIKATTAVGGIDISSQADIDITTTGAAGEDISLVNTGGSVVIQATESAADAVLIESTAGGVQVLASGAAAGEDILITATGSSVKITATEAAADAIVLSASTAVGGIDITSNADIDITTTGAAGEDITVTNTGGSVNITATEPNAADAIVLTASNRGTIDVRGALNQNVTLCLFEDTPVCAKWGADGTEEWGGVASGTAGHENICMFPGASFIYHIIGTQTVLGPIADVNGFDFSLDDTTAEGVEYCPNYSGPGRQVFTVGTDAFYLKVTMTLSDVSGFSDVAVGFRLQEDFQNTIEGYNSYNCLSVASGTINHMREINGGSAVDVSSGDAWADNSSHTLEVRIAADKTVTYFIDGDTPTTPVTHSWTDADQVCPFLFILNSADVGGPVNVTRWECGLQY